MTTAQMYDSQMFVPLMQKRRGFRVAETFYKIGKQGKYVVGNAQTVCRPLQKGSQSVHAPDYRPPQ